MVSFPETKFKPPEEQKPWMIIQSPKGNHSRPQSKNGTFYCKSSGTPPLSAIKLWKLAVEKTLLDQQSPIEDEEQGFSQLIGSRSPGLKRFI